MKKIIDILENMMKNDVFKYHIYYLRFPHFKNFKKDFKINFDFPITFLTGVNGTGKSSLLHVLYGSVNGKSISEFWFNTYLDPIKELKENRNCFICSFKTIITRKQIEILKERIQKKKIQDKKNNSEKKRYVLDYWEPARPKKKYNMNDFSSEGFDEKEIHGTRWKLQEREVLYMDFRYHLSAYDKYFYFAATPNLKTIKTKQDYLRSKSRQLNLAFQNKKKQKVRGRIISEPFEFDEESLNIINKIIGKKYKRAQLLEHNLYSQSFDKGFALKYTLDDKSYSEAYAGSGETAIAKLVYDIMKAKENTLVLLDEPETSLHPKAQNELVLFLLEQIKLKKLQIIISTHSPNILMNMPKEAIRILYENPEGKVDIIENVTQDDAFFRIGHPIKPKQLIVEDKLAKLIIDKVLKKYSNDNLFETNYHPGGAKTIYAIDARYLSQINNKNTYLILDGDEKKEKPTLSSNLKISEQTEDNLQEIIKNFTGCEIKFDEEKKIENMIKFIDFSNKNIFFLPGKTPEELIWSDEYFKCLIKEEQREKMNSCKNFKEKFNMIANILFDGDTSEYQFKTYELFLKFHIDQESSFLREIKNLIEELKSK